MILTSTHHAFSQQQNSTLNREFNLIQTKVYNEFGTSVHTSFQPIIQSHVVSSSQLNWLSESEKIIYNSSLQKHTPKPKSALKWLNQSFLYQHFLVVDTGNFYLTIDPLLNLEYGKDAEDKRTNIDNIYTNTRGLMISGNIGKNFSFRSSLYENQSFSPAYISDFVNSYGVMPGQGRVKKFKQTGFDYAYSSAYISYSPTAYLNFQIGNDKHFIGDGYRSLLLSDVSTNYPFIRATALFLKRKIQYNKLHAELTNLERRDKGSVPEALFKRKTMSVHFVNWTATNWLNIGLFESTVWQTEDSSGTLPFNFMQLNPIPFVNTLKTGFNNTHHSSVGLNVKIKLPFKTVLYHQTVYDGSTDDTRIGIQGGLSYYGIKNLTLQSEFNTMSPDVYESNNNNYQGYNHYNQPLAHLYGNNFNELIGIVNYKYKRLFSQAKLNFAEYTENISKQNTQAVIIQAHLGYLINPSYNLAIIVGATNRTERINNSTDKTNYIYVSLLTNLRNLYTDF